MSKKTAEQQASERETMATGQEMLRIRAIRAIGTKFKAPSDYVAAWINNGYEPAACRYEAEHWVNGPVGPHGPVGPRGPRGPHGAEWADVVEYTPHHPELSPPWWRLLWVWLKGKK